ncbi:MAG: hypothetical protein AB7I27_00140 [Bacteriovoracaceae bacterium]
MGKLYFDIKKAGELVVQIETYEQPSMEEVDNVEVSFFCKGTAQDILFFASCLFLIVGAIGFITTLFATIFKTFRQKNKL